jgi:hypothetical protein
MATGTAGTTARKYSQAQIHYVRKNLAYTDGITATVTIGKLPAGALVVDAGVAVTTVWNFGTNNLLNMGTTADPDGFATSLSLATVGLIKWDEFATSNDVAITADTDVTVTYICTGTAATTGAGVAYVAYLADN